MTLSPTKERAPGEGAQSEPLREGRTQYSGLSTLVDEPFGTPQSRAGYYGNPENLPAVPDPAEWWGNLSQTSDMLGYCPRARFDPAAFPLPVEKVVPVRVSSGESTSLLRDRTREPDSSEPCPRSKARYLSTQTADFAVFPPCKSRTCGPCKARKDESDYARVAYDLAGVVPYIADGIPPADWQRWRRWAYRQSDKPKAWSMGSSTQVGMMAMISEVQFDQRFRQATPAEVLDLLERRTTANTNGKRVRFNLTGVNTTTATEWESQIRPPKVADSESFQIHPTVTPDKLEAAAEALGIPCKRFGVVVRFTPGGNKADLQRLRDYARNGKNPDSWSDMLAETEMRQGALLDVPPCTCETEGFCNGCY